MAIIYISSTFEDLKKEREAAAQAVRRLGHQPVCMEDYVASPQQPVEKCLQDVRSCDAYVGIFALRYGFIPDGYEKSITHLEYETAKESGIPCLIFLLDQKASWPVEYEDGERRNIDQLRKKLKNDHIVSFFKNADELSGLVNPAVSNLISKSRKPGKEMEEVSTASKSIAIGIQKTGKEKLIGSGEYEPQPGPKTEKAEISIGRSEDFSEVKGAKKVYKNKKGFTEADYGDGIIMVYIPPGKFEMVSNDFDRKKLTHEVYLDGYRIGKYEVTIKQYMKFVNETKSHYPEWLEEGSQYHIKTGGDDYYKKSVSDENSPILGISWEDARAYCEWLSKKTGLNFNLPTEAQWEKAARGNDSRQYPWGEQGPDPILANFGDNVGKTTPVGSYPEGASPYGLLDMAGNVWEWCSDWYGPYNTYYLKNPTGPDSGTMRVVRGGSWYSDAGRLRCAVRDGVDPSGRSCYVGFRLCQDDK
jgi:formylglycine-generating enzyme required for sulfatase activity